MPGKNNIAIANISFEKRSISAHKHYTLEETYELYLISRGADSLAKMLADVPVYNRIDTVAIPYVLSLLTDCIMNYFADIDVTSQGNEKEQEEEEQEEDKYLVYNALEYCQRKNNFRKKTFDAEA